MAINRSLTLDATFKDSNLTTAGLLQSLGHSFAVATNNDNILQKMDTLCQWYRSYGIVNFECTPNSRRGLCFQDNFLL